MVDDEVFFVKLDAYNHRGFQRIHGLRSVPHLIHLHEDSKLKHKKASPEFRVAKEDTYHQKVLEPTVDELLGWMNAKTEFRESVGYRHSSDHLRVVWSVCCQEMANRMRRRCVIHRDDINFGGFLQPSQRHGVFWKRSKRSNGVHNERIPRPVLG
mmetsp:Transcript_558/g.517  ORF Transcript_558/g.517 Transcript_558/m.517 type:complete len:155 (+) Transcript_558:120-584(+)